MKTKLKWHDARKKLPKKDGFYLVVKENGNHSYVHFSTRWMKFNTTDSCNEYAMSCVLWAKVKVPKVIVL